MFIYKYVITIQFRTDYNGVQFCMNQVSQIQKKICDPTHKRVTKSVCFIFNNYIVIIFIASITFSAFIMAEAASLPVVIT